MFRTLSLVLCLVAATHQLDISNFTVPAAVRKDSDAQLVCSHDGDEKLSIVKWFWTPEGPDSRRMIYQHVPGGEKWVKSNDESLFNITLVDGRHDLMLWNLQPEHSGSFECQVEEEHKDTSQELKNSSYMVVYTIGDSPQLRFEGDEDDDVEVICEASGVAPQPEVFITYDSNTFNTTLVVGPENGLYNASANVTLAKQDIEGVEISCSLSFQDDDIPTSEVKVSQIYHSDAWRATTTDAPEDTTELQARLATEQQNPNRGRRTVGAWIIPLFAILLRALPNYIM